MLELKSIFRRFMENRRRHPRMRRSYPVQLLDALGKEVFRGKSLDVSRGGIHVRGSRLGEGVTYGQRAQVRILASSGGAKTAEPVSAWGRVCRLEERGDCLDVAMEFEGIVAIDDLP
jgi:hypothetical protein